MRVFSLTYCAFLVLTFALVLLPHASMAAVLEYKTFKVSAYYSPQPGQDRYVSGSYSADLAMNGNGTHGADGTPVYVGMISAPSSYAFGTKISIPGLGVGTVHDRGGAIFSTAGYDKLDIWMGYGDDGRIRAINWGSQMVEGAIVSSDTAEGFVFDGEVVSPTVSASSLDTEYFSVSLWQGGGQSSNEIQKMQAFLIDQEYLTGEATGIFDTQTTQAVFRFQNTHRIVLSLNDYGAGTWGPKTRAVANSIYTEIESSHEESTNTASADTQSPIETTQPTPAPISATPKDIDFTEDRSFESALAEELQADTTDADDKNNTPNSSIYSFETSLWRGKSGQDREEVQKVQMFLWEQGLYNGTISGKFSAVTEKAVMDYQLQYNIIQSSEDVGAGVWGPKTRSKASE